MAATPPVGTIALLLTDIEGSTELARRIGARWPDVLAEHHRLIASAIDAEGGWVDGTEGDAFFATFTDPAGAARAAVAALRAVREHAWDADVGELKVRMGLHVGYVERNPLGYVGLEVHRAARIAGAAHGGQLLLSAAAHQLLSESLPADSLGTHRLKDFPQAEHLYCAVIDGRGASAFPPPRVHTARANNLPAGVPVIVGRDAELPQLIEALAVQHERLVTLTGRSGAGKTTLALAASRQLLDSFDGGAWLADLTLIGDPADVTEAIATAVGARREVQGSAVEAVIARLRDRGRTLLLIDNFEHVLAAAPELAQLLEALPELQILVTSQAPLHLGEELCLPLDALADDDALALVERVGRRRNPGIRIDPQGREALLEVIHLLDGLPLALELAAARLALLTPQQLLERLRGSAELLRDDRSDRPDRHRSLLATVDWSLGLLDPGARALFTRLGAFAGPVEVDDLEAVCGGDGLDVLEALFRLLEVALVRRVESGDGRIRFGLPEGLRQIAAQQLDASPDGATWRRAHAQRQHEIVWATGFLFVSRDAFRAAVDGTDERRAALAWAKSVGDPVHLPMAAAHAMVAADRGHLREALEIGEPLLSNPEAAPEVRTLTLIAMCWVSLAIDRHDESLAMADEAIATAPDARSRAYTLLIRGAVHAIGKRNAAAVRDSDEGLALARSLDDGPFLAGALLLGAQAHMFYGDMERCAALLDESQRVAENSDADFSWRVHTLLGDREVLGGRPAAALEHYARSLEEAEARAHEMQILFDLIGSAIALAALGRDEDALEVVGLADRQSNEIGGSESIEIGSARSVYVRAPQSSEISGSKSSEGHMLSVGELVVARERLGEARAAEARDRGRAVPAASRVTRACQLCRATVATAS